MPEIIKNDIIDLDLSVTSKKKFRFDHDDNRIVELNVSDMNILSRMSETYPKLQALQEKAAKIMDGVDFNSEEGEAGDDMVTAMSTVSSRLKEVDDEMRDLIDHLFDADVSAKAAPFGSMYDLFEGSFRFEHIITLLIGQYENNMDAEYKKMEKQLNKHTSKYHK